MEPGSRSPHACSIQNVLNEQLECLLKKVQALIASNDDMRAKLTKMLSTLQLLVLDNK